MSYQQLQDADMNTGYTGGWCLKFVQDAFHTDHIYPTALDAWNANYGGGNHPDEIPPLGITVPVYFSLGNEPAGHIAIRLDDGWVASSTQPGEHPSPYFHKSLDDLISVYGQYNGGCTYLGWSEYVGSVRVVQLAPEPAPTATDNEIQQAYQDILERPADDGGIVHYRSYPIDFVRQDLLASDEYKTLQDRKAMLAAQPAPTPVTAPVHNPDVVPVDPTPAPVAEEQVLNETPIDAPVPAPVATPAETTVTTPSAIIIDNPPATTTSSTPETTQVIKADLPIVTQKNTLALLLQMIAKTTINLFKKGNNNMNVSLPTKAQWINALGAAIFSFLSTALSIITLNGGIQTTWQATAALLISAGTSGFNAALYILYVTLFKASN